MKAGHDSPRTDKWSGAEATLIAGINYHRQMIDAFEQLLGSGYTEASEPSG